jgi:hypothetical protein
MKEPKSWQTCQVGASASSIESLLFHDITSQQQQLKTTERERESVQVLHLKRELWPLSLHKTVCAAQHLLSFNSSKMRIGFTSFLHFSHVAVALDTGRCVSTSMCACITRFESLSDRLPWNSLWRAFFFLQILTVNQYYFTEPQTVTWLKCGATESLVPQRDHLVGELVCLYYDFNIFLFCYVK